MILDKTKKYIAAVSGGPDSMALLHKFHKNIIGVCHVNYHVRIDSDYDTSLVAKDCKKFNIPLKILNVNKETYQKAKQHNFEALARDIRYDFFVKCTKTFKCTNLLIAHNLNDFLETAQMQKNRKSKNFYYGIKPINTYKCLTIYRPLIKEFKADLEKFCNSKNIKYAIDSTNSKDIYERNRIRKQLNKLSKSKLLLQYKAICLRNKEFEKKYKQINEILKHWMSFKLNVAFFKKSNFDAYTQSCLIYLLLKKYNITNINHEKINLVINFILSNKSNIALRIGNQTQMVKINKQLKIKKAKYGKKN